VSRRLNAYIILGTSSMGDTTSSSSGSSVDTPPSSDSSPTLTGMLKDVSEEDKTHAVHLKAEANEAFKSASPSLLRSDTYPVR